MHERYEDDTLQTGKIVTEQEHWEEHQIAMARQKTAKHKNEEILDDYDYVFDEQQIDFVLESTVHQQKKDGDLLEKIDTAERRG